MGFNPTRSERLSTRWRARAHSLAATVLVATLVTLLGAGALMPSATASAQVTAQELPTAAVTPEDAVAYIAFTLDEESDQWQRAATLLDRIGLGGTLEEARDEAFADAAGNDLPFDAFLGGEVAIVFTSAIIDAAIAASAETTGFDTEVAATPADPTAAPAASGAAFILDSRAPDTAFAGIRSALDDDASDAGTAIVEVDYQGTTIEYIPGDNLDSEDIMAVSRVNDLIVVAPSPADIEPIIDTSQGITSSLADSAPFQQMRDTLGDDFLLFSFVNAAAAAEAGDVAESLGLTAGTLGQQSGYSGLLIRADDPGFRMETAAVASEGETLPPAAANFASDLVQQTPGDALFFVSAADLGATAFLENLGAALLGAAFGQTGTVASPTPDQSMEELVAAQYEQAAQLLGFNIQTELIQQLVGEYGIWLQSGADPASITALVASGVQDPGTVVNALQQLTLLLQSSGADAPPITTRQVGGSQVNVVDLGDPSLPGLEYGVVGDQLLIGVGDAIDTNVTGPTTSLAENEQFQTVMATLPAERNGTIYVDFAQIIPLLQGLAESSGDFSDDAETEDASPDCANYETQEAAQVAYDAGDEGTFDLDQDFDGAVCEDFFGTADSADAEATPADPAAEIVSNDYSAVRAFALAAYDEAGMRRSSSILYIEP